jgi:hypothetical protein
MSFLISTIVKANHKTQNELLCNKIDLEQVLNGVSAQKVWDETRPMQILDVHGHNISNVLHSN